MSNLNSYNVVNRVFGDITILTYYFKKGEKYWSGKKGYSKSIMVAKLFNNSKSLRRANLKYNLLNDGAKIYSIKLKIQNDKEQNDTIMEFLAGDQHEQK